MATVNSISEHRQSPSAMRGVMDYCRQKGKVHDPVTGRDLVSGIHCGGDSAYDEFMLTKQVYGKTDGVLFYQFTQSFQSRATISSADAHTLALEFAERAWPGHEVLVCTHCDTDNPHSHFVINSVSWQDGRKLHQTPAGFRKLRELSDEICLAHGYPVIAPKEKPVQGMSAREYRSAAKGESWKLRLMFVIDQCMRRARTRKEFEEELRSLGYAVRWTAERRYITYTTPTGMKCRDNKLHEEKYLKEAMEHEFTIREKLIFGVRFVYGGGELYPTGWEHERELCFRRGETDDEYTDLDREDGGFRKAFAGEYGPGDEWADQRTDEGIETLSGDAGRGDGGPYRLGDSLVDLVRAVEGQINQPPVHDATTMPAHTDRKRLRQEQEKKIAMGHKEDDHEDPRSGPTMTTPW